MSLGLCAVLLAVVAQNAPALAISGAHMALPGQFPYQALVQVVDLSSGKVDPSSLCAGALIHPNWVLTAASCARVGEEVTFKVTLGAFDVSLEKEDTRLEYIVLTKSVHEGYDKETGENDIALLELQIATKEDDFIAPIRLPSKKQAKKSFVLWNAAVSGWGSVKADDKTQGNWVLRWFDSRVEPNFWCKLYNKSVRNSDICVASLWKKGTCFGDAGNPVAITEWDNKATLVGIASSGTASCDNHKPPVFTRITTHLEWISRTAGIALRD